MTTPKTPRQPLPSDPTDKQLDTHLPASGTLPDRVIRWFAANPDEELYSSDIAIRFDVDIQTVSTGLIRAVEDRFLERELPPKRNSPGGSIYRAGPLCQRAAARMSKVTAARAKVTRPVLPKIDLAAVVVEHNVPIAPPYAPKGRTRYDDLFDLLDAPGASTTLPHGYAGTLQKAAIVYSKRTGRTIRVARESIDRIRIHRTADKQPVAQQPAQTSE